MLCPWLVLPALAVYTVGRRSEDMQARSQICFKGLLDAWSLMVENGCGSGFLCGDCMWVRKRLLSVTSTTAIKRCSLKVVKIQGIESLDYLPKKSVPIRDLDLTPM